MSKFLPDDDDAKAIAIARDFSENSRANKTIMKNKGSEE